MSTDFRWGILASGGIARAFARDLSYFNNHIVAAVGSRSKESADAFATEFPGCVAYGSYEELVNDPTHRDRLMENFHQVIILRQVPEISRQ